MESKVLMPCASTQKILICDDNDFNLYTLRSLLEMYGFEEIYEASDGKEAFDLF